MSKQSFRGFVAAGGVDESNVHWRSLFHSRGKQWQAMCAEDELNSFRTKHGVLGATDTGPAAPGELQAAREAIGHPNTHKEWLKACERHREGD